MRTATEFSQTPLLTDRELPAAEVENPDGRSPIVLACEHASFQIPGSLKSLGLSQEVLGSHAAGDIGALKLARRLSAAFDAALVASRVSRLVFDCNRPPEAETAIPAKSEIFDIPGNRMLSEDDRQQRFSEIYVPFFETLKQTLDAPTADRKALVTIHSFTPVFHGQRRSVELGLLHDADARLAEAMSDLAPRHTEMTTRINEPYAQTDGVMHTLEVHAQPRGLLNIMIEVRNDYLASDAALDAVARDVTHLLQDGLKVCGQPVENAASGTGNP